MSEESLCPLTLGTLGPGSGSSSPRAPPAQPLGVREPSAPPDPPQAPSRGRPAAGAAPSLQGKGKRKRSAVSLRSGAGGGGRSAGTASPPGHHPGSIPGRSNPSGAPRLEHPWPEHPPRGTHPGASSPAGASPLAPRQLEKSAPGSGHWRSWGLVRPAGVTGSSRSWNQLPTCSQSGGSPGLWIETSDSSQWVLGDAPVAAWTIFNSVCRSGAGPSARSCQRSHVLERMQIFVPGLSGFPLWTFILSWLHGALRARGWSVKRGNSLCMARVSGDAASAPLLPSPASSATLEQIPRSLCISVPSRPPPGESQLPYLGVELRASVVDSHVAAELGCARGSSLWESA
ncbi:uncharacterized protein LOC134522142 [Chroicocephalus ridibundus]|uniref:uncharacterized protein LOC134522142 n=1 Tax=Chroicocephalus ridibundus TaxID=1192867 RepID=UPI002FDEB364